LAFAGTLAPGARLPDKVRARTDRKPTAPKDEIEREEKRDANGLFTKGTKPGPGRPPGSPNKIPKSIKEVRHALSEGAIEVGYPDPLTGQPTTGPVAHRGVVPLAVELG